MRTLRFLIGLFLATALQVLGVHLDGSFLLFVDLFLVLAVAAGLDHGPVGSMLAGSVAGLAQDALTGGLFGLNGFADTFVAWAASRLEQRVVIQRPLEVGLLFALAAALQQTLLVLLQYLMLPGADLPGLEVMALRMATSGLAGMTLFVAVRRSRERLEAWRERRRRRLALEID
jgi:rod shape-determining protein MreD